MPPTVVTLTCPNCGSGLRIPDTVSRFACTYCGTSLEARREGGIVSLEPVVQRLDSIDSGIKSIQLEVSALRPGIDSTSSELAIQRLDKELTGLYMQLNAVKSNRFGCGVALAVFGVLGFVGSLSALSEQGPGGLGSFGLVAGLGILWLVVDNRRVKREKQPILDAIARAHNERQRHLATVQPAR